MSLVYECLVTILVLVANMSRIDSNIFSQNEVAGNAKRKRVSSWMQTTESVGMESDEKPVMVGVLKALLLDFKEDMKKYLKDELKVSEYCHQ